MNFRKILVALVALAVMTMLFSIISCSSPTPPAPVTVKETVVVVQTVVAPAATAAPAPAATAAPKAPVAKLSADGLPANAALPGAITSTLSYITSTAVGPAKTSVALGTTGLSNVPINVPVMVLVSAADPKNSGKPTWSLTSPSGSKTTITNTTAMGAKFTPDMVGAYMVSVSLKNDAGLTSDPQFLTFNAGTFIGVGAGNCQQCHAGMVAEWGKTGHATILKDNIDNSRTPAVDSHYTEGCIRCHTTGYYLPAAKNGGFADAQEKTGWKVPTWDQINAAGKKTGPSNFDTAPAEVKNMGNIQCEQCHGPANEHVKNGAKVMAVSFSNQTCDVCHAGGGHHIRGLEILNSKHSTGSSFEEVNGPGEQACVRCHTAGGFASFLKDPKNPAAWENEEGSIGCAACHDPHNDKNYAQLRVVGKPVEVPFANPKDVGLSAACETCHNIRRESDAQAKNITDGKAVSYPHYSAAAEMLNDLGGITYGQTIPNSPHGAMVGAAPVPNPAFAKDPTVNQFMWSKAGDAKGNTPGACVFCHMQPGIEDAKDPNIMKVGDHSFNTVSPDGKFDYGVACKSCHGDVKDFNMKAKADYDGNGKVEGDQDEIKGLLNTLWKTLESKGWKKNNVGGQYADIPANADAKQKAAWFNFRYVYGVMWGLDADGKQTVGGEGKAAAIHNFKRSVALLQLSLKDLGALPAVAADGTK